MVQPVDPSKTYPSLLWDTQFQYGDDFSFGADWVVDEARKDLQSNSSLHTAIILSLFTDRRAPADVALPYDDDDRRGWWGDSVDVRRTDGEQELGSFIWLYERSRLDDEVAEQIRMEAERCLQHLKASGVAARIDVSMDYDKSKQSILLLIDIYSRDGTLRYSQKYHRTWTQTHPELA
jgi:phage gp46-like protein